MISKFLATGGFALDPSFLDGAPAIRQWPTEDAKRLREALKRTAAGELLLVLSPEKGLEIDTRDNRVALYKRGGVRPLALKIRQALVPRGEILILVDSERGTGLTTIKIAEILAFDDESDEHRPACMREPR